MTLPYSKQIEDINEVGSIGIRMVNSVIKPMAKIAGSLLRHAGKDVGFFLGKHREFRTDSLLITMKKKDFFTKHMKIYYNGKLVMHVDDHFSHVGFTSYLDKGKHLFHFESGEWEQLLMDEYREMASRAIQKNFGVTGERCKHFDHDKVECGLYDNIPCPCGDYREAK